MNREREKEKLITLRSEIAKENGQSTYLVYNDEELETLLDKRPKTIDELSKIKGFPKDGKRVAAYGDRLVAIFDPRGGLGNVLSKMENSSFFK